MSYDREYKGKVSIGQNSKGEIVLVQNDNGAYTAKQAKKLWADAQRLAVEHEASINTWSFWKDPNATTPEAPELQVAKWGKPKLVVHPGVKRTSIKILS